MTTPLSSGLSPAVRAALESYRARGTPEPLLQALDHPAPERLLLVLQHLLRQASDRTDRDALEDFAFRCHGGVPPTGFASDWDPARLASEVESHYGALAFRVLSRAELPGFAVGLARLSHTPAELACAVALAGAEIERRLADTLTARPAQKNTTIRVFRTSCSECGGADGNQGHLICPDCLARARARAEILFGPGSGNTLPPDTTMDDAARFVLDKYPTEFGCARCRRQPNRDCNCARSVQVPGDARDGQVLAGRYVASGKEWLCTLRFKG